MRVGPENTQVNQTDNSLVPRRLRRLQPYRQTESKTETSSSNKYYAENKLGGGG